MKKLEYKININAPAQKVWDVMLGRETYKEWTGVSWPGSLYKGNWKKGEDIRFVGPDDTGLLAHVTELIPAKYVSVEHIAVLVDGGVEDRTSDLVKGMAGITESYSFTEKDGTTDVLIEINTNPAWQKMFDDGWPAALDKLKEITERN